MTVDVGKSLSIHNSIHRFVETKQNFHLSFVIQKCDYLFVDCGTRHDKEEHEQADQTEVRRSREPLFHVASTQTNHPAFHTQRHNNNNNTIQ